MFKKEDFNISYYLLHNPHQYDVVILDNDVFDDYTIIESYVSRTRYMEALDYIKYMISYSLIHEINPLNLRLIRKLILRKCNSIFSILEKIKADNYVDALGYTILIRYLEELSFKIIKSNPTTQLIPQEWLRIYNDKQGSPRSKNDKSKIEFTKFCFINTDPNNSKSLICKKDHDKQSFIGLLFASGFTKKMKIGKFRAKLYEISNKSDFLLNSTKDYIKREFKPSKFEEKIRDFLDILKHNLPNKTKAIEENTFTPSNIVSERLAKYILQILDSFPERHEYSNKDLISNCFDVEEKSEEYYFKELGHLILQIENYISY